MPASAPSPIRRLTGWLFAVILFAFLIGGGGVPVSHAQDVDADEKKPLTHDVYDEWKQVNQRALSDDGAWVLWSAAPEGEDATLTIKRPDDGTTYTVDRGVNAQFAPGAPFVVTRIEPPVDSVEAAQRDDVPDAQQPKPALGIVALGDGAVTRLERVQSMQVPDPDAGMQARAWIAYHHYPPVDTADAEEAGDGEAKSEPGGAPLVVRHLPSGQSYTVEHATGYDLAENGERLLVRTAVPAAHADTSGATDDEAAGDEDADDARLLALTLPADGSTPGRTVLHMGASGYPQMVLTDDGSQAGFLVPDTAAARGAHALHRWRAEQEPTVAVAPDAEALPAGWVISEHGSLSFSEDGTRLFFGTAPEPPEAQPDTLLEKEKISVDVWHWQDPFLQPMQKERLEETREQTYRAVHFLEEDKTLQLATEAVPAVTVSDEGNGRWALGVTNRPYRKELSWDWPPAYDAHLIDLRTGERERVLEGVQAVPQLSPEGTQMVWWDRGDGEWRVRPTDPGVDTGPNTTVEIRRSLSRGIPHPVHDQRHDVPYPAGPYGLAGWTDGDERVLIYDRHDIWSVDPNQPDDVRAVTDGLGREENLRLRHVRLARSHEPAAWGAWPNAVNPPTVVERDQLLLSAFQRDTKAAGFYRDRLGADRPPERLILQDKQFSRPVQADAAERLLFTRESFQEFPDLWVSGPSFSDMQKVSDVNPQQAEYRWGTAELVEWTSANGEQLEGILYKPEGFDPSKKYPMMTYFYEQYSDDLHAHYVPEAHRSIINFSFYVSRGYVVFVPDIHYEEGYPGESAMQSVMPGVSHVLEQGFVDRDRIGVQGHSWGGYQIAYMVTQTDLFAAAEAGAPVSNMVSAYGGIRWGSGLSRMFQYEETQSRIGGSLWDMPMRYVQNSPIFWADRIETPLLIMHNDQDGAVPWEQGIELFVALRRLGKPAWLINYNGADHWPLRQARKEDWTRRMQQYFDHYLKGAPAPVWLEEGIPAERKGRTLGLEPAASSQ
jgi:dipeptidyl aminopeptidase/acylaminoacyl peptidase